MKSTFEGRAWKYGDNINTDVIFPGKYTYQKMEPEEMAKHALEDLDENFVKQISSGDILIAGKNFGMGSSREQAAICIKYAGISVIIAKSFSRIFFRNSINAGMPAIACPQVVESVKTGDTISVDLEKGIITVNSENKFTFPPYPDTVMNILNSNGLVNYIKGQII